MISEEARLPHFFVCYWLLQATRQSWSLSLLLLSSPLEHTVQSPMARLAAAPAVPATSCRSSPRRHLPLPHAAVAAAAAASLQPARCSDLPFLAIDKPKTNPEIFLFSTRYQPAQFLGFVFSGLQNFVFFTFFYKKFFNFWIFLFQTIFLATDFFSPPQLLVFYFLLKICFFRF